MTNIEASVLNNQASISTQKADYQFFTTWRVQATCEEVYAILEAAERLPEWWPSVYLDVKIREKGQSGGIGKLVALHTKGWLPYTLKWQFKVTDVQYPSGFSLTASGDFAGTGIWHFEQDGEDCIITYDWKISAEKPLLKKLTWLLRSVFSANHHWAMRKGYESLVLELRRRRGEDHVPPPPRPTFV